ncbi:unnamed protein product [Vitrella brassicaformis CCMP3155]|uniref:poly(A)-specific ribonuclease n=3 Tax=Vitrella brassicaformis TaxID=1169539 RepID=A0A0G4G502_VITBC|nr:unnamed protein product [Vitrella brassicaformis CCMP3155]|eukprot:CEM23181.1 unnamed protein product [Vitrella brassicaformis CCMP3155]
MQEGLVVDSVAILAQPARMNGLRASAFTLSPHDSDSTHYPICEVWADNLEHVFREIQHVVENYKYIAMDTEFPGIVVRPTSVGPSHLQEYNYQTVKGNVDLLKVIQLGITFADSHGNLPPGTATWQFNFKFDLQKDMYAHDSIEFLKMSGINFEKHQEKGIEVEDFGELIMTSGLVMNEDVKWISFHGSYDFGYLLKLLTCQELPNSETEFFDLLHDYFPSLYDIKFLLRSAENIRLNSGSSLQKIAEHLDVRRVGPQHQAGSDSLVTCHTFFKLMATYFENQIDDSKYSGIIYGLGAGLIQATTGAQPAGAAGAAGAGASNPGGVAGGVGGAQAGPGASGQPPGGFVPGGQPGSNPPSSNQLTFTPQVQNPQHQHLRSLNESLSNVGTNGSSGATAHTHHGHTHHPHQHQHHNQEGAVGVTADDQATGGATSATPGQVNGYSTAAAGGSPGPPEGLGPGHAGHPPGSPQPNGPHHGLTGGGAFHHPGVGVGVGVGVGAHGHGGHHQHQHMAAVGGVGVGLGVPHHPGGSSQHGGHHLPHAGGGGGHGQFDQHHIHRQPQRSPSPDQASIYGANLGVYAAAAAANGPAMGHGGHHHGPNPLHQHQHHTHSHSHSHHLNGAYGGPVAAVGLAMGAAGAAAAAVGGKGGMDGPSAADGLPFGLGAAAQAQK